MNVMNGDNLFQKLKELKVDIWYTKDSHFNACIRIKEECNKNNFVLILLIIFASLSSVINTEILSFFISWKYWGITKAIIACIGVISGSIALYISIRNPNDNLIELSLRHKQSGEKLNFLFKRIKFYEASIIDSIEKVGLETRLNEFLREQQEICIASPMTQEEDYKKSQENFQNKTWEYSDNELNL